MRRALPKNGPGGTEARNGARTGCPRAHRCARADTVQREQLMQG
jgi:hypothetical protein